MTKDTPQLCIDPFTGAEVLYAPQRAQRTNAMMYEPLILPTGDYCPFCPGNEHETPPHVYRWPTESELPWQLRLIPNRYPAVAIHEVSPFPELASSAFGQHEVMIESQRHDDDWLTMSADHLARVFDAIAGRIRQWSTDPRFQHIQVFKNVGSRAGATLAHPHLQLLALNYLPKQIVSELMEHEARVADYLDFLLNEPTLLVQQDELFLTLCPPVSRVPYELWIVPRRNVAFSRLMFDEHCQLASHLQSTFHKLETVIGKVAHNVVWRLPPSQQDHLSWRIEILPRLTTFAGLELGTGLYVNPIRPEVAAAQLVNAARPA